MSEMHFMSLRQMGHIPLQFMGGSLILGKLYLSFSSSVIAMASEALSV